MDYKKKYLKYKLKYLNLKELIGGVGGIDGKRQNTDTEGEPPTKRPRSTFSVSEIYIHFTCNDRYESSIKYNGLMPNAPPLIDKGTEGVRPLHLLKGRLLVDTENNKKYIIFNNAKTALNVLCFITFECCQDYGDDQKIELLYFTPKQEDNIEPMEQDKTDYITKESISNDRLNIGTSDEWYYIKNGSMKEFKKLIKSIKNCGNNDICNSLYKI